MSLQTGIDEYRREIRSAQFSGLRRLWRRICSGVTPGWPRGKALEYLVLRAFELNGAVVTWPFEVRFEGETGR